MLDRRAFAGLALAALAGCALSEDPPIVRLGSGGAGGFFRQFALLLVDAAARSGDLRIDALVTAGSGENLEMLGANTVDAGLVLADAFSVGAPTEAVAVGRLYESYLQLAVLADSSVTSVEDLRGKRVDLGVPGSGASMIGERVLQVAGLDLVRDVTVSRRPLVHSITALDTKDVDAIFWGGGVPTRGLGAAARLRLIDIGEYAVALTKQYGHTYDQVRIPAHAYQGSPAVSTVGVASLLVVGPSLADATVGALTDLLLHRSAELVPDDAAGTQFLDGRWLGGTGTVPLHPAAAARYREWHG